MNSRAQITVEFLILIGILFIFILVIGANSLQDLNQYNTLKESEAVRDVAIKLQRELFIAANVEDGYVRQFSIPDKIDGLNYSIQTNNLSLYVSSKNAFSLVTLPYSIGNLTKGNNLINKSGGTIYVNQ